jgi:mannose-6-phosphate isomerase class I
MTMAVDSYARGLYDPRPVLEVPGLAVLRRQEIEQALASLANGQVLLVDGFLGIDWDSIRRWMSALSSFERFEFLDVRSAMRSPEETERLILPFLGDPDPVFGTLFQGTLEELFDPQRLEALRGRVRRGEAVVFGPGAGLVSPSAPVVYLEVSKETLQTRSSVRLNLGQTAACAEKFYKRAYFIDWPVLERHRHALRSRISLWIDANGADWVGVHGTHLERAIQASAGRPFRTKPWFLPGPWGGQFLKHHVGLDATVPNIAWSYELIAPENGVLIGDGQRCLELPFAFMLAGAPVAFLGVDVAALFENQFPIRFDYLDTMLGGNLSCQCHPSSEFIRGHFGERFTQDESYYIVESEPNSSVYLGFREDRSPADFWRAAKAAQSKRRAFDIGDYINAWPSKKHDIFLIPNGTVHCSGSGNLVLEVSATPYIYTFKIYDYLRPNLNGQLRHLYIDYAERNTCPARTTSWVHANLIPRPKLLTQGTDWQEYIVSDNPLLFYDIQCVEFSSRVTQRTDGGVLVVNLVEGEEADLVSSAGTLRIHYAETAVVPAATGPFELVNRRGSKAKLLKAFVRTSK